MKFNCAVSTASIFIACLVTFWGPAAEAFSLTLTPQLLLLNPGKAGTHYGVVKRESGDPWRVTLNNITLETGGGEHDPKYVTTDGLNNILGDTFTCAPFTNNCFYLNMLRADAADSVVDATSKATLTLMLNSQDASKTVGVAVVPIPATLPLLGSGIALFGFMRRRKKPLVA